MYVPATRVGAEDTPDHSDELSAVERITMTDPNTITDDATLYDPLMLTKPWRGVHHYDRETSPHDHVNYYTCDQNVYQKPDGNTAVILPGDSVTLTRIFKDTTHIPDRGGAIGVGGGTDAIIETGTRILNGESATAIDPGAR